MSILLRKRKKNFSLNVDWEVLCLDTKLLFGQMVNVKNKHNNRQQVCLTTEISLVKQKPLK